MIIASGKNLEKQIQIASLGPPFFTAFYYFDLSSRDQMKHIRKLFKSILPGQAQ